MKIVLALPYIRMYYSGMKTVEVQATSILTPQKVGSLAGGYQYSLNPYAGCAFSCSYCYVPKFPSRRNTDFMDWGKWLEVKINAPELVRKERTRVFGSSIFFSSATDPYQYAELKYRLSRKCLEQLLLYKPARLTLHTRSHLILQDLELLKKFGNTLDVGVSITTDDESVREEFEPRAPSIARRLEVLKVLSAEGISVHASVAPLLPMNPDRFIELLSPYVDSIWIDSIGHQEVNTRKELLQKYKTFFESKNQQLLRNKISSYFSAKSSTTKSAMVTSASALSTYKEKEEDRQITLVI